MSWQSTCLPLAASVAVKGEVNQHRAFRLAMIPLVVALANLLLSGVAAAQFSEWASFSINDPFSVTAAVRGLESTVEASAGPTPQVRLEALVGYSGGAQNQFDYHSSIALPVDDTGATGVWIVQTRDPISFTTSGVQSVLNGLCCSNNAIGLDDDRSIHAFSDFNAGESWEVVIGTPEAGPPPIQVRQFAIPQSEEEGKP